MSTAVLEQPTVADLEARVLAGEKIAPADLAAARHNEDALKRIAELDAERAKREKLEQEKAENAKRFAQLKADFQDVVKETGDVEELLDLVRSIPLRLKKTVHEHNRRVYALRSPIGIIKSSPGDFECDCDSNHINPGVTIKGVRVHLFSDWEFDMRTALEDGMKAANGWTGKPIDS